MAHSTNVPLRFDIDPPNILKQNFTQLQIIAIVRARWVTQLALLYGVGPITDLGDN